MGLFRFLGNLFLGKPRIDQRFLKNTNRDNNNTYNYVCNCIQDILDEYKSIKIGKTGNPKNRITQKDYNGQYSKMFLILKSKKRSLISNMERESIREYDFYNDNISMLSGGRMSSPDGYYYLYVVAD